MTARIIKKSSGTVALTKENEIYEGFNPGRLLRLEIINCLGIKSLQVNLTEGVNMITGPNGAGKSTVLDVINALAMNVNPRHEIVTLGQQEAIIKGEFADGSTIERFFYSDGRDSQVRALDTNGKVIKNPETMMKDRFGVTKQNTYNAMLFSPVKFLEQKPEEQLKILSATMPLECFTQEYCMQLFGEIPPVNLSLHPLIFINKLINESNGYFYANRTEANKQVKEIENEVKAVLGQLPDNYSLDEWESFDIMELANQILNAQKHNAIIEKAHQVINSFDEKLIAIDNAKKVKTTEIEQKYSQDINNTNTALGEKIEAVKLVIVNLQDRADKRKQYFLDDIKNVDENIKSTKSEILQKIEDLKQQIADLELNYKNLDADKESRVQAINSNIEKVNTALAAEIEKCNTEIAGLKNTADAEISGIVALQTKDLDLNNQTALDNIKELNLEKEAASNIIATTTPLNIEDLKKQYETANTMKSYIQLAKNYFDLTEKYTLKKSVADRLDMLVKLCRELPKKLLNGIEMPYEGLSLGESGILINGVPLQNLNTAEQIKIAIAIAKYNARSVKSKIICIDGIERFDEDTRNLFISQCNQEKDFQYLITQVAQPIDYGRLSIDHPELIEQYKTPETLVVNGAAVPKENIVKYSIVDSATDLSQLSLFDTEDGNENV